MCKRVRSEWLKFLMDDHTKFDGKLNVGAPVTVGYRTEDVIAVHIVVHSAAYSQ